MTREAHLWGSGEAGGFLAELSAELSWRAIPLDCTSEDPVGGVLGASADASTFAAWSGDPSGDWAALCGSERALSPEQQLSAHNSVPCCPPYSAAFQEDTWTHPSQKTRNCKLLQHVDAR